jgi:hypothetical protein
MSGAATPIRSVSITRSSSPTRAHHRTHKPSPLAQSALGIQPGDNANANHGASTANRAASSHDPMRMLPDKIRTMIFCLLGSTDLANCTLTCQKWKKSQTINHGKHDFSLLCIEWVYSTHFSQLGINCIGQRHTKGAICLWASGPNVNPSAIGDWNSCAPGEATPKNQPVGVP